MSPNDEIHSNYMTGNDYSFTGNERKMFPFCINLPKDLIIAYAKVQLNILSGLGVINFETLFRLIAQFVLVINVTITYVYIQWNPKSFLLRMCRKHVACSELAYSYPHL